MKNKAINIITFIKSKKGIALVVIIILGAIFYFSTRNNNNQYQFVAAHRGSITEVVSVTGNTTPVTNVSLAFESGGTITATHYNVGDHVGAGNIIAKIDTRDLEAQLQQAQANTDSQKARLQALHAGATPEDIQVSRVSLAKAQQDLNNMYSNVNNIFADSYSKANDAVRNQLASFFTNPETNNPQLTFPVSDSQALNDIQFRRIQASNELNVWSSELSNISSTSSSSTLEKDLLSASNHLLAIKRLLDSASTVIVAATNLNTTLANTYKTNITTAQNEVNVAAVNANTATQNLSSQKITIQQLQAQLNLKLAGSTADDIAAQAAQVEQAQATVQSINVKIQKASMIAPVSGVITKQDAKVGQIASPGTSLVSIISDTNLEIDAQVPEVDIGKVSVNDNVAMTIDAFPGETFDGILFYIDPAQTLINGVVDYKIKVSFKKADSRIKSGLTTNLSIATQKKDNVVILPQYAILQTDAGTFIKTLDNGIVVQKSVTLGIRDQSGNVEVLSGVNDGEQVINIGLK